MKIFKGKPMHPNYDSHYIQIQIDDEPAMQGEAPAFEDQIN